MTRKYELVPSDQIEKSEGVILSRIIALLDIPKHHIKAGDMGGYVQSVDNLAQDGDCWIRDSAIAYEDARISGDAILCDHSIAGCAAQVSGDARMFGHASIYEHAQLSGSAVMGGASCAWGKAHIYGDAVLSGDAEISGSARVCGSSRVGDHAEISGHAIVSEHASINGYISVTGRAKISGKSALTGYHNIQGRAVIKNNSDIYCIEQIGRFMLPFCAYRAHKDIVMISYQNGSKSFNGTLAKFKQWIDQNFVGGHHKEHLLVISQARIALGYTS